MTQLRFPRRTRRGREWFPQVINSTIVAAAAANQIIDSGLQVEDKKDSTIVRMLIDLSFQAQGTQKMLYSVGITLMNADAHAAGALPEPGNVPVEDADWLWTIPRASFSGTTSIQSREHILNIRTKRKYSSQADVLVLIIFNAGPATMDVDGSVKSLILDPP